MKWDRPTLPGFDSQAKDFMPLTAEIPVKFFDGKNEWNARARTWIYRGVHINRQPKSGVCFHSAREHLRLCYAGVGAPYDTVVAACAYLMSLWFEPGKPAVQARPARSAVADCTFCHGGPAAPGQTVCAECFEDLNPGAVNRLRGPGDAF